MFLFWIVLKSQTKKRLTYAELLDLKEAALASVSKKTLANTDLPLLPGKYETEWGSFILSEPLTSPTTTDVNGYAYKNKYVAIVRNKDKTERDFSRKAFVLPEKQKLVMLKKVALNDDQVTIYKTKKLEILDVFSYIHLTGVSHTCSWPSCNTGIHFHWDDDEDEPEYETIKKLRGVLQFGYGATLQLNTRLDFEMGLIYARVKFQMSMYGEMGIGFKVPNSADFGNKSFRLAYPILGGRFSILGISIAAVVDVGMRAGYSELKLQLPELGIYKGRYFELSKTFTVGTDGRKETGWNFKSGRIKDTDTGLFESWLDNSNVKGTLFIDLSVEAALELAKLKPRISAGFRNEFPFNLYFDKKNCYFPYLAGSMDMEIMAFLEFTGFEIPIKIFWKTYKIKVSQWGYYLPIYSRAIYDGCITPKRAQLLALPKSAEDSGTEQPAETTETTFTTPNKLCTYTKSFNVTSNQFSCTEDIGESADGEVEFNILFNDKVYYNTNAVTKTKIDNNTVLVKYSLDTICGQDMIGKQIRIVQTIDRIDDFDGLYVVPLSIADVLTGKDATFKIAIKKECNGQTVFVVDYEKQTVDTVVIQNNAIVLDTASLVNKKIQRQCDMSEETETDCTVKFDLSSQYKYHLIDATAIQGYGLESLFDDYIKPSLKLYFINKNKNTNISDILYANKLGTQLLYFLHFNTGNLTIHYEFFRFLKTYRIYPTFNGYQIPFSETALGNHEFLQRLNIDPTQSSSNKTLASDDDDEEAVDYTSIMIGNDGSIMVPSNMVLSTKTQLNKICALVDIDPEDLGVSDCLPITGSETYYDDSDEEEETPVPTETPNDNNDDNDEPQTPESTTENAEVPTPVPSAPVENQNENIVQTSAAKKKKNYTVYIIIGASVVVVLAVVIVVVIVIRKRRAAKGDDDSEKLESLNADSMTIQLNNC